MNTPVTALLLATLATSLAHAQPGMPASRNAYIPDDVPVAQPSVASGHITDIAPSPQEVHAPFGPQDAASFVQPPRLYWPETWFHFIGGNVSREGITADMKAIKQAGISGIQWFHGNFGGLWPGIQDGVKALTPEWEDLVAYVGQQADSLGLRLTLQTCPGWAMAGGPWIKPENAMRHLAWSRTDLDGSRQLSASLTLPLPDNASHDWHDWQDVCVLAFPTPQGDTGGPLKPQNVQSADGIDWQAVLTGTLKGQIDLPGADTHTLRFTLPEGDTIRTVKLPSVESFGRRWVYQPGVRLMLVACQAGDRRDTLLSAEMPMSNWQDIMPLELACHEAPHPLHYELTLAHQHEIKMGSIQFLSAAHKNHWRAEAGWTLMARETSQEHTRQSPAAFLTQGEVRDITTHTDGHGRLRWTLPDGRKWTVLRIGHINTGAKNGPAPAEATGWECNKLDSTGADIQFANYVGHLMQGPLAAHPAAGMLMDSWECLTQTWTPTMEREFEQRTGYALRPWLPALMGYVVDDQERTSRFLLDWRRVLTRLYCDHFFRRMTQLAHRQGMKVQYETAGGDVTPMDPMEYYKYADVPMCEFWQPFEHGFVGDVDFKPIRPTASAARLYGKTRVAAEAFTSFQLTWDEHWQMLRDVANFNMAEGATHPVFHTYTHNPHTHFLPPGTSFGSAIGTPFLRQQTWWPHMGEFTRCLARTGYMLERGVPVSDVLWYLGDEAMHRPSQHAPFPLGFRYDYCNTDILTHRLTVSGGLLCTPEGLTYRMLWIPHNQRMLTSTVERIGSLLRQGALVVASAPCSPATLMGGKQGEKAFRQAVERVWGKRHKPGLYRVGKGTLAVGMSIQEALEATRMQPDVQSPDSNLQWLHRRTQDADWYFVAAPPQGTFRGQVRFRCQGIAEEWNPVNGRIWQADVTQADGYTTVSLDLKHAESRFIVFRHQGTSPAQPRPAARQGQEIHITGPWRLSFPQGWGAPDSLVVTELKPWKDLPLGSEGRSFSGTATYTATFHIDKVHGDTSYLLHLGRVDMIAEVLVNGHPADVLWTEPYATEVGRLLREGDNTLTVRVTSTWFNRLAHDASLPEADRKTWTISGPAAGSPLRDSGLMGPVTLEY